MSIILIYNFVLIMPLDLNNLKSGILLKKINPKDPSPESVLSGILIWLVQGRCIQIIPNQIVMYVGRETNWKTKGWIQREKTHKILFDTHVLMIRASDLKKHFKHAQIS